MAVDPALVTITTGYNLSKINDNFVRIEEALQDVVSRSGESPNTMSADLDMNGQDILNTDILSVERLLVGGEEFVPDGASSVGPPGVDGEDATITVGTVTTGPPGTDAIIVNVGTPTDAIFDFTIPKGDTGASGAGSGDMVGAQNLADVSDPAIAFSNIKQAASALATGVVELATNAEVITGTDTTRVVTPAGLQAKLDSVITSSDGYRFLGRQVFTVSGTYTPTLGTTLIHVIMCGGGGGGGGANAPSGVRAGGGGSGAETIDFIMLSTAFTPTVAVVVGTGGNGGSSSGSSGSDGVNSTFGSYAIAVRGLGGNGSSGGGWGAGDGASRASVGTVPAGGLRFQGEEGGDASRGDGGSGSLGIDCVGGNGGSSYLGGAGNGSSATTGNASGRPGGTYGGAGGGAASSSSSGAGGGDGAAGVVIIYEFTDL